jgi:hypothetical protein
MSRFSLSEVAETYIAKKNHLHAANLTNIPMKKAPRVPPTGQPNPKKPRVKFLILPGGNVIPIIATIFGITNAAPMPVNALAMAKVMRLSVQKPLITDQTIHHAPPTSRTFLWPYTAPMRPLMRTNAPWVSLDIGTLISNWIQGSGI